MNKTARLIATALAATGLALAGGLTTQLSPTAQAATLADATQQEPSPRTPYGCQGKYLPERPIDSTNNIYANLTCNGTSQGSGKVRAKANCKWDQDMFTGWLSGKGSSRSDTCFFGTNDASPKLEWK